MIVEDTENNVFGGVVNREINYYYHLHDKNSNGTKFNDINMFIFSLRSNGRINQPKKIELKENSNFRTIKL